MNYPMIKENTATPTNNITHPTNRSTGDYGLKSPYPIVERVVIAKYQTLESFSSQASVGEKYIVQKLG